MSTPSLIKTRPEDWILRILAPDGWAPCQGAGYRSGAAWLRLEAST